MDTFACETTYYSGKVSERCGKDIKAFSEQYKHRKQDLTMDDPYVNDTDYTFYDVASNCGNTASLFEDFIKDNKLPLTIDYKSDATSCYITMNKTNIPKKPPQKLSWWNNMDLTWKPGSMLQVLNK
jgi:hypothetical protein